MNLPFPLLATTPEDLGHSHSVMDALPHLGGMIMVLITLAILWGLSVLISKIVAKLPAAPAPAAVAKPAAASPSSAPAAATPAAADGLSLEIVAVIAAAVAATAGPDRRIISIRGTSRSWEMAGRQSVLTSHRIR